MSPAASMATTDWRNVGQFIATSSNMLTYWEPCPENSAATLEDRPRPETSAVLRKVTPWRGSVQDVSRMCDWRCLTAPSSCSAICWASFATKPRRAWPAGMSARTQCFLVASANARSSTLFFLGVWGQARSDARMASHSVSSWRVDPAATTTARAVREARYGSACSASASSITQW